MKLFFKRLYNSGACQALRSQLGHWYDWLWFRLEFWISDLVKRRPFTFMMRDFAHYHPHWTGVICGTTAALFLGGVLLADYYWCTGNFWKHLVLWLGSWIAFAGTGMVLGHVLWGQLWIPGQQEAPPYLGA